MTKSAVIFLPAGVSIY